MLMNKTRNLGSRLFWQPRNIFFGSFTDLFAPVTDPRHPELITYPLAALLFAGLWLFVCRLGARRPNQSALPGQWPLRDEVRSALRRRDLSAWRHPPHSV
jgi:hypothetical protein